MTADPVQRKLAALLSADVVGYSRLMAEDEAVAIATMKAHREIMAGLVRQHAGRVVDAVGDNLLADFPSVVDAVACAVEIQEALAARNGNLAPDRQMLLRIGVNLGDVVISGDAVYGNGVNIAARLEALAEPGGICVSGTVCEHIRQKLTLDLEDLGEQTLKNVPHPVRVYRVRPARGDEREDLAALTVPGFAGRPAIAVLAFDNLSDDREQEYFADGIAEDLTTRLSAWRTFPVIARNSSFVYRGQAVDVKQVSRALGVRYVVEGSVRKAGDRVRISAQLIDATTGHHVWAERYDRDLRDIFALQDEITKEIVGSMSSELLRFEEERAVRKEAQNLDAWDYVARGLWYLWRITSEDNARARALFERAATLDPSFAFAVSSVAMTHLLDGYLQWTGRPTLSFAEATQAAERSVALDGKNPYGLLVLAWTRLPTGQRDRMIAAFERAIDLDPSFAMAYGLLGLVLSWGGRPEEGIESLEKAMRLSPHDPLMFIFSLGMSVAHFATGEYDEAADWARRSVQRRPVEPAAYRYLAASYAHLGRTEEARCALREMVPLDPKFSLATDRIILSTATPDFVERLVDGLRKAGWKE